MVNAHFEDSFNAVSPMRSRSCPDSERFHVKLTPAQLDLLLQHAQSLPGAQLEILWGGVQVLKVAGKMFATFHGDTLAYKVADEDFLALSGLPGVRPTWHARAGSV